MDAERMQKALLSLLIISVVGLTDLTAIQRSLPEVNKGPVHV